ncbi:dedicator of cytokinesis protein 9-like [Oppia nitens]|uniref:dedicator of cytokinesis protein 9-like n=1 Tax=Oppia nitens TaxID=1686743 RepID=UPI0023DB3776|nr:dedicator of cytokinesis protein 9-like [Oppia nitens]
MAERRFTRLKASLSETAAKTRENVSRELRQSMVSADSVADDASVGEDYESFVRKESHRFVERFPENDISIEVIPPLDSSASNDSSVIAMARECCRHLSTERRVFRFQSFDEFFGSVFDICSETTIGKGLRTHALEEVDKSEESKEIVRESAVVMNRMNGFLSLWRQSDHCFLSFFRDRKREHLIWTQEVTQEVRRSQSVLHVDCHAIELPDEETVIKWQNDINGARFDARRSLSRIGLLSWKSIQTFEKQNRLSNLFIAYHDLNKRKGLFSNLKPKPFSTLLSTKTLSQLMVTCFALEIPNKARGDLFRAKLAIFDSSGKQSSDFRFRCDVWPQKAVFWTEDVLNDAFIVLRIERQHNCHSDTHWEPFAWSFRSLNSISNNENSESFGPLFRSDSSRISDDSVIAFVTSAEKPRTLTTIGGQLTTSFRRITAIDMDAIRVDRLRPRDCPPEAVNHVLFVSPVSLRYESQKLFPKARNLQLSVELRDSDSSESISLSSLNGIQTQVLTSVQKHNPNPDFNEEIRIQLPNHISDKLHVLFTFSHVSCKKECVRHAVGYSWLPIGRHSTSTSAVLSVFGSLPQGYLSCQSLGLGKGLSMPDTKCVAKDVFKLNLRLNSSLLSRDAQLNAAADCLAKLTRADDGRDLSRLVSLEAAVGRHLRSLTTCDVTELVRFCPIVVQLMLDLVVTSLNADVRLDAFFSVIRLAERLQHRSDVIARFVDMDFRVPSVVDSAAHETLAATLVSLLDSVESSEEESRLVLRHLWFPLRLLVKALVQWLFDNSLFSAFRENRFSRKFSLITRQLVSRVTRLITQWSRADESQSANRSLSHFICRLLSLSDRSEAFNLADSHLRSLYSRDVLLSELRLHFLAILLSHEHLVALSDSAPSLSRPDAHFLPQLLFRELRHALSQSVRHVRQLAVQLLRNLLAKHALDRRYSDRKILRRVVSLYRPTMDVIAAHVTPLLDTASEDPNRRTDEIPQHARHHSLPARFDVLNGDELRDLLICFAFQTSLLSKQDFRQLSASARERLLIVMETIVNTFAFKTDAMTADSRSRTLPSALQSQDLQVFLCRQNLSVETTIIALRSLRLTVASIGTTDADDETQLLLRRSASLVVCLLSHSQSPPLVVHIFDVIALMARDFPKQFFSLHALFAQIVAKVVEYCDCALKPVRDAGVDLLFSLFVLDFKRTRFETIVCVSRVASLHNRDLSRFQSALTRLQSLADAHEMFSQEDQRLAQTVCRVRDILRATHRIRTECRNAFENCELRLFLANSYAQTSWALRRTWIENLAAVHLQNGDWPEHAMCLCHAIAILVEQLRAKGVVLPNARQSVGSVSPNVANDDTRVESDDWLEAEDSSHVTLESLERLIDECCDSLDKSQLFELAPHLLQVLVDHARLHSDHKRLSILYTRLSRMHCRALEANESGRRLFDTYFRVAHFGSQNSEYVYRESKAVSLAEMTAKLQRLHPNATIVSDCDADAVSESAIVVTHVTPLADGARDDLERFVGQKRFVYEQRISREGFAREDVQNQMKRRVVLHTSNWLPFCVKRVPVVDRKDTVLQPIEVAIDEMESRVQQLERVLTSADAKHLQLVLQGSVSVTVNCGPVAYARAFLRPNAESESREERRLRTAFARFLNACERALKANERLIKSDQTEYHSALKEAFERMRAEVDVEGDGKRTSVQIFDVISGSSLA